MSARLLLLLSAALGCSAENAPVDKAARCASEFGGALTAGFGRLDGTVLAVVPPGHPTCPRPNSDHLVIQIGSGGAVYRMVVNVESDRAGDPRVAYAELAAPLAGAPFSDGWQAGSMLDYIGTLNLHKTAFTPMERAALVDAVTARLELDAPVSIYATTSGGDSAHLVHRNASWQDGAIVVGASGGTPLYLLFAFDSQSF